MEIVELRKYRGTKKRGLETGEGEPLYLYPSPLPSPLSSHLPPTFPPQTPKVTPNVVLAIEGAGQAELASLYLPRAMQNVVAS